LPSISNYKTKMVNNCIRRKLGIDFRHGPEPTGWYYLDGKKRLRVTVPKEHGGRSTLSPRTVKKVMNNLRIDKEEFAMLYECPMSGKDYEIKIRRMISIGQV